MKGFRQKRYTIESVVNYALDEVKYIRNDRALFNFGREIKNILMENRVGYFEFLTKLLKKGYADNVEMYPLKYLTGFFLKDADLSDPKTMSKLVSILAGDHVLSYRHLKVVCYAIKSKHISNSARSKIVSKMLADNITELSTDYAGNELLSIYLPSIEDFRKDLHSNLYKSTQLGKKYSESNVIEMLDTLIRLHKGKFYANGFAAARAIAYEQLLVRVFLEKAHDSGNRLKSNFYWKQYMLIKAEGFPADNYSNIVLFIMKHGMLNPDRMILLENDLLNKLTSFLLVALGKKDISVVMKVVHCFYNNQLTVDKLDIKIVREMDSFGVNYVDKFANDPRKIRNLAAYFASLRFDVGNAGETVKKLITVKANADCCRSVGYLLRNSMMQNISHGLIASFVDLALKYNRNSIVQYFTDKHPLDDKTMGLYFDVASDSSLPNNDAVKTFYQCVVQAGFLERVISDLMTRNDVLLLVNSIYSMVKADVDLTNLNLRLACELMKVFVSKAALNHRQQAAFIIKELLKNDVLVKHLQVTPGVVTTLDVARLCDLKLTNFFKLNVSNARIFNGKFKSTEPKFMFFVEQKSASVQTENDDLIVTGEKRKFDEITAGDGDEQGEEIDEAESALKKQKV